MSFEAVINDPIFGYLLLGLVIIFGPLIAKRLGLPGLLGLLIGGALVGPNMLSILDDFTAFENIGQLGILYLIFLAGLQMDLPVGASWSFSSGEDRTQARQYGHHPMGWANCTEKQSDCLSFSGMGF